MTIAKLYGILECEHADGLVPCRKAVDESKKWLLAFLSIVGKDEAGALKPSMNAFIVELFACKTHKGKCLRVECQRIQPHTILEGEARRQIFHGHSVDGVANLARKLEEMLRIFSTVLPPVFGIMCSG